MLKKLSFLLLAFIFLTCSKEKDSFLEETFLDKIEDIVWTRGTNYKTFKSKPFKLYIVENGICLEFKEGDNQVRENTFNYSVEKITPDTLQLGYKVQGEKINHCGTFTYHLDTVGNLIRTYKECTGLFDVTQTLEFYTAEKTLDEVCFD